MKNFIVYSKTDITKDINIQNSDEIKFLKQGFKPAYLLFITGFIYSLKQRLYLVAFLIFLVEVIYSLLTIKYNLFNYATILKVVFNSFLVIFGTEVEEFFIKRKGYKIQGIVYGKNVKEVQFALNEKLTFNFTKKLSFLGKIFKKINL